MKKVKVLFVDDNPVNLIAAENLMSTFGFKIDKADNGLSAIELASHEEYDLIFVDLLMPDMDGILTTQMLRKKIGNNTQSKFIATSGIEMNHFFDKNEESLFDGKIQKPFNLKQLKICLEDWLGRDCLILHKDYKEQTSKEEWDCFIEAMNTVKGIHMDYLLEFNKKDVAYFIRLISSSRKQIVKAIEIMKTTVVYSEDKLAHEQLHALKSVLYYVGAHNLFLMAQGIDHILISEKDQQKRAQKFADQMVPYQLLIGELEVFCYELEQAMNAYNKSIKNYQEVLNHNHYTVEELSKRIEQILYHIERFEYIEILNGLNYLRTILSQEIKAYIEQAITALEEFDYEMVESLLRDCWNDIVKR